MPERVCTCGHIEGDHGQDPDVPDFVGCNAEDCECDAFEHDPDAELDFG